MAIVSSYVFCGSINPNVLFFHCVENVPFVGGSIAAVAIVGMHDKLARLTVKSQGAVQQELIVHFANGGGALLLAAK